MIRVLALLLLASPAAAFDIDYAQVMAENPDAITQTGESTRRADLPGDVHVIETTLSDGTTSYFGYDDSPAGAAGCTFGILVDLTVATLACPDMLDGAARDALADNLDASARFVAANTVPPVPSEDIDARLEAHIQARADALRETGLVCTPQDDPQLTAIVRAATNPAFRQMLDRLHAVPRLPVASPCL